MKKTIILILLFLNNTTYSQALKGLYVFTGINNTQINSEVIPIESALGFELGLIYVTGINQKYNFQTEASIISNSINLKSTEYPYNEFKDISYSSLNFNVGFYGNYHIIKPDENKLFFGPQLGLFFKASPKGYSPSDGTTSSNRKILPYLTDQEKFSEGSTTNYGLGLGLSGGYNKFKFALRYNYNLKKYFESSLYDMNTSTYTDSNIKINTFSFTVGYLFSQRNRAIKN